MSEPGPTRLPDDDALVIGEGVLLDLQPATFATRMLSALLDYTILGILLMVLTISTMLLLSALDPAAAGALFLTLTIAVMVGLPTLVETLTRGKSVGRFALGLRVVRDDGGPIRVRHSLIRALLSVLEIWGLFGAPALLCSLFHPRGKRLGDVVAGTYVVRERGHRSPPLSLQMPGQLAAWARTTDIVRLPDDLAMSVRTFMIRRNSLAPAARDHLGRQLADEVRARVAPAPPAGTTAEDFLAAVLLTRRDRELARLQREQQQLAAREQVLHRLPHG